MIELTPTIPSTTQVSVLLPAESSAAIDHAASYYDAGVIIAAHQPATAKANVFEVIALASAVAVATTAATTDHSGANARTTYSTTLWSISSASAASIEDSTTAEYEVTLKAAGSETPKIVSEAAREVSKASKIVPEAPKTFKGEGVETLR